MGRGKIVRPKSITATAKNMNLRQNVCMRVLDARTHEVVSEHIGHNAATNGLLTGIGHYLTGDGILNQGWSMLSQYIPRYISVGTMGLISQDEDENGYPDGIGVANGTEQERFESYMLQVPGYGADGYDANTNNNREYFGLGPMYTDRESDECINCELITTSYPRQEISYRDIVPETEAEYAETIDVVFSAMIPVGNLAKFRDEDKDYLFVTECGLWSRPDWTDSGDNGLLAGYRIAPPDSDNWDMSVEGNRELLKSEILRVNKNQVIQVIWKIQLGAIEQLTGLAEFYEYESTKLYWTKWDEE